VVQVVELNITALTGGAGTANQGFAGGMVLTIIHMEVVVVEVQALWELTSSATNSGIGGAGLSVSITGASVTYGRRWRWRSFWNAKPGGAGGTGGGGKVVKL
jgi:hypothetical protein